MPDPETVVDPTLANPTDAQTGSDGDVAEQALAELAAHVADTSVKDLLAEAAEDQTKAAQILAIEEGRGDQARSTLVDALQKQLAPPTTGGSDAPGSSPAPEAAAGPPVDENGRQIAQPDLIDNSELDDPATAAEKLAAGEDEAIKVAAANSGRLVLDA